MRVESFRQRTGTYTLHARRFADVALGDTGETVRLWATADGAWTYGDSPFASGTTVAASNGVEYTLTYGSAGGWTASPVASVCEAGGPATIRTLAGAGTDRFGGDGGPAVEAQLDSPAGVAVDSSGNVYVADTGNHRIRRIDPDGTITTFAGTGVEGYGGDGGPAVDARLDSPVDVAVDASGNVYVADFGATTGFGASVPTGRSRRSLARA